MRQALLRSIAQQQLQRSRWCQEQAQTLRRHCQKRTAARHYPQCRPHHPAAESQQLHPVSPAAAAAAAAGGLQGRASAADTPADTSAAPVQPGQAAGGGSTVHAPAAAPAAAAAADDTGCTPCSSTTTTVTTTNTSSSRSSSSRCCGCHRLCHAAVAAAAGIHALVQHVPEPRPVQAGLHQPRTAGAQRSRSRLGRRPQLPGTPPALLLVQRGASRFEGIRDGVDVAAGPVCHLSIMHLAHCSTQPAAAGRRLAAQVQLRWQVQACSSGSSGRRCWMQACGWGVSGWMR
ncbi:hypothetical protein COO60DRAFT_1075531 [Scenedesmus sp. NREL 46B-D3]|nr:hypothetical protein COO60DRAFT_1075531 [Scenedesmus sp. NREL 46B-D3]